MEMTKIRIMVVDDHAIVRDGIISMLQSHPDFEIIGESSSGEEAVELVSVYKPDIILMDIMMSGIDGIETVRRIKQKNPTPKIIMLSMEVTQDLISQAIKAGAMGYIPKDSKKHELIEAIQKVNSGERHFSTKISEVVFKGFYNESISKTPTGERPESKITKREIEVLKLIASGLSNREIADSLFISIRTVDAHRNHIIQKLKLKTTAELVRYAIKHNIVDLK